MSQIQHSRHSVTDRLLIVILVIAPISSILGGPLLLKSEKDVQAARASVDNINISSLPINSYPSLARLKKIGRIEFYDKHGKGADDERLHKLALVNLPLLEDVSLLNCPAVTDDGIKALSKFSALKLLQLEGTSITDAGVKFLVETMAVTGLNIANCDKVTIVGIKILASAKTARHIVFSAEKLDQSQVLSILNSLQAPVEHCEILDLHNKLNAEVLEAAAKRRGIQLGIWDRGALQEMNADPPLNLDSAEKTLTD